jgi:homoserine O-acetyltransferase/O-succinyltransferase
MQALMPIACFPERVKGRNLLWRRMLIDIIRQDPDYNNGDYKQQPANLGIAWELFYLMVDSPMHLQEAFADIAAADANVLQTRLAALKTQDANDTIYEFDASYDYDPYPDLAKIKARLLVVNFADDGLNVAELGIAEKAITNVKNGKAVLVPVGPKSRGHQSLRIAEIWNRYVTQILQETETRGASLEEAHA